LKTIGLNELYKLRIHNVGKDPAELLDVNFDEPIASILTVFGRKFDSVYRALLYARFASLGLVAVYDAAFATLPLSTFPMKPKQFFDLEKETAERLGLLKQVEDKETGSTLQVKAQITTLENLYWTLETKKKALRAIFRELYHPRKSQKMAQLLVLTQDYDLFFLSKDLFGMSREEGKQLFVATQRQHCSAILHLFSNISFMFYVM
jgi:hypothetical protein